MVRKFLLILLLCCVPLVVSYAIEAETEATTVITASDGFALSCATGFIRVTPHFCLAHVAVVETWTVFASGCNNHVLSTVPASAQQLYLRVTPTINSSAIVNTKNLKMSFFNDALCSGNVYALAQLVAVEWVIMANAPMATVTLYVIAPPTIGKVFTNTLFSNTGLNSQVVVDVLGYYD